MGLINRLRYVLTFLLLWKEEREGMQTVRKTELPRVHSCRTSTKGYLCLILLRCSSCPNHIYLNSPLSTLKIEYLSMFPFRGLSYKQVTADGHHSNHDDDNGEEEDDECADEFVEEVVPKLPYSPESCLIRWKRILHRTWIPEERCIMVGNQQLVDSVEAVRLMKFFVLTVLNMAFVREFVRWFDLEHDTEYTYGDMILYDGPQIVLDITTFFLLGRLYNKRLAVDHLAFVLVMLAASLYVSLANEASWYQHSFTLYEIHCTWPWQLFVFVSIVVPLSVIVLLKHVQFSIQTRVVGLKLIEMSISILLFLAPQVSHSNFHLHHWYIGWLIGMHCNFDTWWSRAAMAWCWGLYINGISVYGRDPLQTCEYAFYISKDTRCSFLSCFMHQEVGPNNQTHTVYNKPHEVDWRNCSSGWVHDGLVPPMSCNNTLLHTKYFHPVLRYQINLCQFHYHGTVSISSIPGHDVKPIRPEVCWSRVPLGSTVSTVVVLLYMFQTGPTHHAE